MGTVVTILVTVLVVALLVMVVMWWMLKNKEESTRVHSSRVQSFVRHVVEAVDLCDLASRAFEDYAATASRDGPTFKKLLSWLWLLSQFPEGKLAVEGISKVAESSMERFEGVDLQIIAHHTGE